MPPTDSNNSKPSILKNTREAKGLTLEIVHEATKIPMDALRAIEEGYSVRILSPFYYRGFIKIYAEFLGLDVGDTYKQYGLDQTPKPTSSATIAAKTVQEPAGPNLFLEQLQEWFAFVLKPKTLKLILKAVAFLLLFLLLFKVGGCIASHMNKKVEKRVRVYNDVEQVRPVPVAAPKVKHEVVQAPSEDQKVEVAVRAIKSTWLQVKTDGNVVFQMTLSKGSMENWSADSKIELSGKDIEQLDMEVNGKHIGPLGGGERRIRKVVITKEGLAVKK
jgi:hypothetical protein